jgi:hypothetical protein
MKHSTKYYMGITPQHRLKFWVCAHRRRNTLSKHIVRSDLNEVATLIHPKLDKKIFVREYSGL